MVSLPYRSPSRHLWLPMDTFFSTITWLGSLYLLLPSAVLICLLLIRSGRPRDAFLLGISLASTSIVVHIIKLAIRRPRPAISEPVVPMPPDWSFPSAHTAQASAFFLALSLIAARHLPPHWLLPITLCSLLTVTGVGYSRFYLRVHYTSDILAGAGIAILMVLLVQVLLPQLPPDRPR
ncbi:MAG: phosphatase PAP2 family protein [Desulfobulbaceae bacterium]|nr:MAG: phosphatase PAP2 family protein [Desulfobulbaceae bacterium]